MRSISRFSLAVFAAGFAIAGSGCSLGQSLGFTPPAHKLTPDAKAFRDGTAPPPAAPRELAKVPLPAHVVEPGDVLLVQTVELDAPIRLPADQPVLPDGTIDLGPAGRPSVIGKTLPQIEAEIVPLVRKLTKEPVTVTVRLIGRGSKVYYVLGEVNAPGAFPISGRETVLDGILAAGGLTRRASEGNILVSRPSPPDGCRTVLPVCYPNIVQLGDTTTNYQLQPGDRIFVPSKTTAEDLFPRKKVTPPCCGPQTSCAAGAGGCAAPAPVSAPVSAPTPAPVPAHVPAVGSTPAMMPLPVPVRP